MFLVAPQSRDTLRNAFLAGPTSWTSKQGLDCPPVNSHCYYVLWFFANIIICDVLQCCTNTLNIALYMSSGLSWNYQQVQVSAKLCCKPRSTYAESQTSCFSCSLHWFSTLVDVDVEETTMSLLSQQLCWERGWQQETVFCHLQLGYLLCWSLLLVVREICENLWSCKNWRKLVLIVQPLHRIPECSLEGKFPGTSNGGRRRETSVGALLQQFWNWPEELLAVTTQKPEKTSLTLHFVWVHLKLFLQIKGPNLASIFKQIW